MKASDLKMAAELYAKAHAAGIAAGNAARPEPMYVVEHANPLDDNSPIVRAYPPVEGGVCGFAWVKIRPASGPFVRYCKDNDLGHKSYSGGYEVWVRAFGQSYERKMAYAEAFAAVLRESGLKAYADGRLD